MSNYSKTALRKGTGKARKAGKPDRVAKAVVQHGGVSGQEEDMLLAQPLPARDQPGCFREVGLGL